MTSSRSMLLGGAGGSRHHRRVLVGTAVAAAAVLALAGPITSVMAASSDGEPVVQTSETVKAELDSSGKLDVARVFSQVAASGHGRVSLEDPTSTEGLRNLDGWGSPSTEDGKVSYDFSVDGSKKFRTVADFTKDLPVKVDVTYTLDGKEIDPDDLAGKSGEVGVTYHISNTTAAPTELTYKDGHGRGVTETVDVVTPYVGQLAIDLPSSFRNVASTDDRADQAGDGHGGRMLTYTMVLFEPIGQVDQELGFTADVKDAAIPEGHIQLVPVSPQNHPELKFGQDGFASGAQTGQDLTAGSAEIDKNVLKLRDGAAQLLDGLQQLQVGADQLSAGLASGVPKAVDGGQQVAHGAQDAADGGEKVAAGAKRVAAGNKKLANGLGALAGGAGQLQTGAHQLSDGAAKLSLGFEDPESEEDLVDGSQALAGALGLISGGLAQLNSASSGLPAAKAGLVALKAAVDGLVIPAIGTLSSPCDPADSTKQSLIGCIQPVIAGATALGTSTTAGLPAIRSGVTQLQAGAAALADPTTGLPAAKGGIDAVLAGINKNPGANTPAEDPGFRRGLELLKLSYDGALAAGGAIDQLFTAITTSGDCGAACQQTAGITIKGSPIEPPGGKSLKTQITEARAAVIALLTGLGTAGDTPTGNPATTTITGALNGVSAGLATAIAGVGTPAQPNTLQGGLAQVGGGLDLAISRVNNELVPALTQLRAGMVALRAGLTNADSNGARSNPVCNPALTPPATGYCGLTEGLAQLVLGLTSAVSGVGQLAPGAAAANEGAGDLAFGISVAGDGAAQLASGADQLSGGLDQVAAKVPDAVAGAQTLAKGSAALADGSAELADGLSNKLAPGAQQLSDGLAGLQAAADGSEQIADGMAQATDGNQQIVDGAGQLSEQGTSQLVDAGDEAARNYGREYAVMQALNAKGKENAMPYGAPEGASDNRAAYDITIAPVGRESGLGSAGRGVTGLVVLGLGALAATLIRGRFA